MNYAKYLLLSSIVLTHQALIADLNASCEKCHFTPHQSEEHLTEETSSQKVFTQGIALSSEDMLGVEEPSQVSLPSNRSLFKISGEYLYLRATQEGLNYGLITSLGTKAKPPLTALIGKFAHFQPSFKPGYRVGASYLVPHARGELSLNYMHYAMDTLSSITPSPAQIIYPLFANQNDDPYATSAQGLWSLKMNCVDLTYNSLFNISKSFSLRPFLGARSAWISQHIIAQYNNTAFPGDAGESSHTALTNLDWNVSSYGPVGGAETNYFLFKGISFFAKGTAALLVGRSHPTLQETLIPTGTIGTQTGEQAEIKNRFWFNAPVFELNTGLSYTQDWEQGGLEIQVGWEEQIFAKQNLSSLFISEFNHGTTRTSHGNLGLSGYTLKASLTF
ncbi:Lpg1974 family pore-forming outer membrane protein [Rhabdochlamydiaceae symbiont of Dictyostelium giganteum]|uniref:Lpg1974 family pore-forming outer membrane protein n=1 Tax=Rhabdochlamydiaceae symbiont of Dictyostelium giganteum TaxID=3342349 RepID=UPI00384A603A